MSHTHNPLQNFREGELMYMVKNDITTSKIDPFNLLGARAITLKYLEEKYIKLRNVNHPDKGGLEEHFVTICEALSCIKDIRKAQVVDKQFFSLRENSMSESYNTPNVVDKVSDEYGEFDNNKFNQFFEKYSFKKEQRGYGEIMDNENKDIPTPDRINYSQFSEKFNENKKKYISDIVEYQVPQAHNSFVTNNSVEVLGDDREDFSGKNYTDYYQAFNQANLVNDDVDIINRNVEDIKKERENPNQLLMTAEQSEKVLEDKELQQKNEWHRASNFKDYMQKVEKYNRDMSELFLK